MLVVFLFIYFLYISSHFKDWHLDFGRIYYLHLLVGLVYYY